MKLRKLIRKIKRLLDPVLGKYLDRYYWKYRHKLRFDWKSGYIDKNSNNHPHREYLLKFIEGKNIKSVLEIGTGNGANLIVFAKKMKNTKFYGIDINKEAIKIGQTIIAKNRLINIEIKEGDVSNFCNNTTLNYDYILSDAVLMYFNFEEATTIIGNMIEIADKGILLCEQHEIGGNYVDHWRHDYIRILNNFTHKIEYKINNIPSNCWDNDWIKFGKVIEIRKNEY